MFYNSKMLNYYLLLLAMLPVGKWSSRVIQGIPKSVLVPCQLLVHVTCTVSHNCSISWGFCHKEFLKTEADHCLQLCGLIQLPLVTCDYWELEMWLVCKYKICIGFWRPIINIIFLVYWLKHINKSLILYLKLVSYCTLTRSQIKTWERKRKEENLIALVCTF